MAQASTPVELLEDRWDPWPPLSQPAGPPECVRRGGRRSGSEGGSRSVVLRAPRRVLRAAFWPQLRTSRRALALHGAPRTAVPSQLLPHHVAPQRGCLGV